MDTKQTTPPTSDALRDLMGRSTAQFEAALEAAIAERDVIEDRIEDLRKSLSGTKAALKKLK